MLRNQARLSQIHGKFWKFLCRNLKTKVEENKKIKFTDTINLPKTKFPARLNQSQRAECEEHIRVKHLSPLYDWQRDNLKTKEYVLHDGPPYANGDLHMGHAINKVLKDIILKQKIIEGTRVHYVPGWDCHGLPIELKALGNAKNLEPLKIREKARKFATDAFKKQKSCFESWGVTGSWNDDTKIYRTFDKSYVKNQLKLFYQMYAKDLIFRDLKPVYFSPSSGSCLAEAELEYDENFVSPSLYFRCQVTNADKIGSNENVYALVWTTTPWTLPANQAICFNKDLKYSLVKILDSNYIVCTDTIENMQKELNLPIECLQEITADQLRELQYLHPINKSEINSFYEASHVQVDKGTGLVHTAPSHGQDDFLVFLNKKIPIKRVVNEKGSFNENAPEFLREKEVLKDGNNLVIDYMKSTQNIVKLNEIKHSYPIDWRTKSPVIILASEQWFIDTDAIRNRAIEELEKVNIYPQKSSKISKNVLRTQLEKRPYWCISRQRSWGVPIPVLFDGKNPIVDEKLINFWSDLVEQTGSVDFWWQRDVKNLIPENVSINAENLTKGNDILDIWFDSGISWSQALEGDKVADLYLEGVDQFTGWFQSSLMTSVGLRDIAPYKSIFVHGFAVDEHGKKMSKSLGNIVSPDSIVKKYGTDVLRWWIAAHSTQHSLIPVSNKLLDDSANNLIKIRGTLKYLLGVIGGDLSVERKIDVNALKHLDKFILHQLSDYIRNVKVFYENFQFNRIVAMTNNFVNTDLSALYLHFIKDRLYCDQDSEHQRLRQILSSCYYEMSKCLWPIAPFLIEESWQHVNSSCSFYSQNNYGNNCSKLWDFSESVAIVNFALDVRKKFYSSLHDTNTTKFEVTIRGNDENLRLLMNIHPLLDTPICDSELCEIFQVASVTLKHADNEEIEISYKTVDDELCPRCRRFVASNNAVCMRCEQVLSAKKFKFT